MSCGRVSLQTKTYSWRMSLTTCSQLKHVNGTLYYPVFYVNEVSTAAV